MPDVNYQFLGTYDLPKFEKLFKEQFSKKPRYNVNAIADLLKLVDLIGRDPTITDVRWAAYILGTVFWETTYPVQVEVQVRDKKGHAVMKNGKPVTVKQRRWLMTMAPVEEVGHGSGRAYHEPVKIAVLNDGAVRVTEQDGDQFSVSTAGAVKALTKAAKMGSPSGGAVSKAYTNDAGSPNAYFGRGYVQLTWWSNYAKSGIAIGSGLDLLKDPDLVKNADTAYRLMAHGMVTGDGFANGHKFADYFSGKNRNYVGARHMVNGSDHAADIAAIAVAFEGILLECNQAAQANASLPANP